MLTWSSTMHPTKKVTWRKKTNKMPTPQYMQNERRAGKTCNGQTVRD